VLTLVPDRSTSTLIDTIRGRDRRRTDEVGTSAGTFRQADRLAEHVPQAIACAEA
jgi:hypothetical protein